MHSGDTYLFKIRVLYSKLHAASTYKAPIEVRFVVAARVVRENLQRLASLELEADERAEASVHAPHERVAHLLGPVQPGGATATRVRECALVARVLRVHLRRRDARGVQLRAQMQMGGLD